MDNAVIAIVNDIINFPDLQSLKNRIIYRSLNKQYATHGKVDFITLSDELSKTTEKVSLDDISRMMAGYPLDSAQVSLYAEIIKEKSALRKLESIMDNKERYLKKGSLVEAVWSLEKDVADVALYGGAKSTAILDGEQATQMVIDRTRKIMNGEITQLKTGFAIYDSVIEGVYSDELLVIAGRSGDGKSAMSLTLANNVALVQNKGVAYFSLEMSTHETVCRLVTQLTGIPYKNVFKGNMTAEQWKQYEKAMEQIKDSKLFFDDSFGMTTPEIRSKIRKLFSKGIDLIVIDQLEMIHGYDNMPLYQKMDKNAYDVKEFTKEFGIPVILDHQLNRSSTDRKLKNVEYELSDLNQAGEKPANQVWFIKHQREGKKIIKSKVSIAKNRNGATMDFPVVFHGERMLFSNPVRPEDQKVFTTEEEEYLGDPEDESDAPEWARK
jgi:replicative DNA helicase